MSKQIISEDEIRETVYNVMLTYVFKYNLVKQFTSSEKDKSDAIKDVLYETIEYLCNTSTDEGFATMRGNYITSQNVHPNFKELFKGLEGIRFMLRNNVSSEYEQATVIHGLMDKIEKTGMFKSMFEQLIKFYLDSQNTENNSDNITDTMIQDTFYNIMVEQNLIDSLINIDDIAAREPYIYIGMSSQVILATALYSINYNGIQLYNKKIVTLGNCPPAYKELCTLLLKIKEKIKSMKLTDNEMKLVKLYSLTNPDINIPPNLEKLKTKEIMELVSIIVSIATEISQIQNFKNIIDNVIKYCIEATQ